MWNSSKREFGFKNKQILSWTVFWMAIQIFPTTQVESDPGLCNALCVWVDISWDWSDDVPPYEACSWAQQPQVSVRDKRERGGPFRSG